MEDRKDRERNGEGGEPRLREIIEKVEKEWRESEGEKIVCESKEIM